MWIDPSSAPTPQKERTSEEEDMNIKSESRLLESGNIPAHLTSAESGRGKLAFANSWDRDLVTWLCLVGSGVEKSVGNSIWPLFCALAFFGERVHLFGMFSSAVLAFSLILTYAMGQFVDSVRASTFESIFVRLRFLHRRIDLLRCSLEEVLVRVCGCSGCSLSTRGKLRSLTLVTIGATPYCTSASSHRFTTSLIQLIDLHLRCDKRWRWVLAKSLRGRVFTFCCRSRPRASKWERTELNLHPFRGGCSFWASWEVVCRAVSLLRPRGHSSLLLFQFECLVIASTTIEPFLGRRGFRFSRA